MTHDRHSVFFGDVALDEYYVTPYFPQAGDKVSVQALPAQFGGMLANCAAIFAHYGGRATFISQLNSGDLTQRLIAQLSEVGLDVSRVIFDDSLPDSKCIILISGDQHMVIIPELGITHTEIDDDAFEHMAQAEFVVTSLTDAAPFRMGALGPTEILSGLRKRGAKIVMDIDVFDHPDTHQLIEQCDIVFMNSIGERRFAGSGRSIAGLLDGGALAVIVTRDSDGCEVHCDDGTFTLPGYPVDPVDVTGAGDTFCSSFLYEYSRTGDLRAAARFANAAAARSIGEVGARAGMATHETVERFRESFAIN